MIIVLVDVLARRAASGTGALTEQRLPDALRLRGAGARPAPSRRCRRRRVHDAFPFDFRQALIISLIGAARLSLLVVIDRLRRAGLARAARPRRDRRVTPSRSSRCSRDRLSHGPVIGARSPRCSASSRRSRRCACVASTSRSSPSRPPSRSSISCFDNARGARRQRFTDAAAASSAVSTSARTPSFGDGKLPSPVFGFVCLAVVVLVALFVASPPPQHPRQQMLAVRSNERAAAAGGISVRNVKLAAFGISSLIAGLAGSSLRVRLRLGHRRPVWDRHGARIHRVCVPRRDHDGDRGRSSAASSSPRGSASTRSRRGRGCRRNGS